MGEMEAVLKQRKDGTSVRGIAQALVIANITIWNFLKKKVTTGVLITRHHKDWPRRKKNQLMIGTL